MSNRNKELWKKANQVIPGGNQLLSKRPYLFTSDYWPTYFRKAKGCEVIDLENKKYFDFSRMAVGACALGYSDNFVNNAVKKVKELIEEEGTPDLKLRVFVSGGGCSGMQYGFTFEDSINEDDTKVEKDNVMLLIDPMSLQYLTGAEIDYQDNVQGSQFVIKNPNATTTCGCGSSFSA